MHKPTVAEVFAGAGLFGAAFKGAGFETVYAAELNPRAVASFNRNVAPVAEVRDARQVRTDVRCQVLVAGPPCQGFSTLGRRDAKDVRNRLSYAVSGWAAETRAQVVVVENVPQFLESPHWMRLRRAMVRQGYEVATWILKSENFGAAQYRTRAFAIFSKLGLPDAPAALRSPVVSIREAFRGLSVEPARSGMHVAPAPSEIALKRFLHTPERGDRRDLVRAVPQLCPPSWMRLRESDAVDVWGRMDYERPANTLRCDFQNASKGRYVHPVAHRVITLREGARIQGVPDEWVFEGMRAHIAEQIGNGVPIPLGTAVAKAILPLFQ